MKRIFTAGSEAALTQHQSTIETLNIRMGLGLIAGDISVSATDSAGGILVATSKHLRAHASYLDSAEVGYLINGLEYAARAIKDAAEFGNFEEQGKDNGGLKLTVFSRAEGSVTASLSSGPVSFLVSPSDLLGLRDAIVLARSTIQVPA